MNIPVIGSKWKHHNGNEYIVYDITNEHAAPERRDEYPVMVCYRGLTNGRKWSKPLKNFLEKMEPIPERTQHDRIIHETLMESFRDSTPRSKSLLDAVKLRQPNDMVREPSKLDILLPKIQVTNDPNFKVPDVGVYYFSNVDESNLVSLADLVKRQLHDNRSIIDRLPFNVRPMSVRASDELLERGINVVVAVRNSHGHMTRIVSNLINLDNYIAIASTMKWVLLTAKGQACGQHKFNVWAEQRFKEMERHLRETLMIAPFMTYESGESGFKIFIPVTTISAKREHRDAKWTTVEVCLTGSLTSIMVDPEIFEDFFKVYEPSIFL